MNDTTLLLVGHGSRHRAGNDEFLRLAAQWREHRPAQRIETCFIEHADVLLDAGLDRAARGARHVIVVPFILNAAGHVKMELPAALARARQRHPAVAFSCTPHLGMGRPVFDVVKRQLARLMRQLAMPDPRTTGVILLGRGSSDAGANGELAKLARWLFEDGDHELVDIAFTGVTWPRLETVVQRHTRLGMTQLCIVPVYLFTGVLIERIKVQVERLEKQYPATAFALGTPFGFDPALLALVDARLAGDDVVGGLLECDGCKYRRAAEAAHAHEHASHHHADCHLTGRDDARACAAVHTHSPA
jgi:sirohydrochlorin cobaltochelatase